MFEEEHRRFRRQRIARTRLHALDCPYVADLASSPAREYGSFYIRIMRALRS